METVTNNEAFTMANRFSRAEARRWGYTISELTPARQAVAATAEVDPVVVVADERELSLQVAGQAEAMALESQPNYYA